MSRHGGCTPARGARRFVLAGLGAVALVVCQVVAGVSVGFSGPLAAEAAAATASGQPNRFDAASAARSVSHLPALKAPASGPAPAYDRPRTPRVSMQPALVPLDPAGTRFQGSDGVLELEVPAGAVTAADVGAAGGRLGLLVRQVLPASGSSAGGWGKYSFGTWLVQVVDAGGRPARQGLRQRLAVKLHQDRRASALGLGHVRVQVNPPLPWWVDLSPASVAVTRTAPASGARQAAPGGGASASPSRPALTLGPSSRQVAALDAASTTLSASVPAASPSTAMSFDTDAPVATFGRPDPFETDLSAGALSAGIRLDLPAGPGGLTPPLTLAYNSAAVSDQHNPQGAAGWVGEGWSLGLGAVSWAEHNLSTTCASCPPLWEDSWKLSDPFGTAADLVPPDINVKTYNDDMPGGITPSPVVWHTAPESRAKVISFQSPSFTPGISPAPPCFRVFLSSGIMEEFGCTPDSLQFYRQPSGPTTGQIFIASWLLDLITDPAGNQVHVTYQQDIAAGWNGQGYPRDAVMATVEYDSPGCRDAQVACTGAAWAPLTRVSFSASHAVAHVSGAGCGANGSLRCDDLVDLSGGGGVTAPTVQSTFVLNDARIQVRSSGSGAWSTLRDYQLSYDQSGPSTITDPVSGVAESAAGRLLLTRLQVIGADGTSVLPARTFGYTTVTQWYEDSLGLPKPSGNCGPSWNNGITPNGHVGCVLWSQSYAGNSSYLSSVSNGLGLAEGFSWQLARNNFHGVVSGSPADPFACNNPSLQPTFPCNMPDDGSWSRAVLTQRTDSVLRLSQSGQGGSQSSTPVTGTWSYAYQVSYPLPAQECSTCVAGFYWGSQNDFDLLDFYNATFMGFAQAAVALPDGSAEVHRFHSTEGFGLYDSTQVGCDPIDSNHTCTPHNAPYWHLDNAAHGHEYELDRYGTDGTTLLEQVRTQWSAACPPPGVAGTPFNPNYGNWNGNLVAELDHSNPVMVCEVHPARVDTLTYDGAGTGPVPDRATTYAYDGYGRVSSRSTLNTTGVFDSSGHANHAVWSGGVGFGVAGLVSGDGNKAVSLDGVSGELDTGYVQSGVTAYSVEVWIRTTDTGVRRTIVQDRGTGGGRSLTLGLSPNSGGAGDPFFELESDFLEIGVYGTTPVNDGQPHHLVGTWSAAAGTAVAPGQFTLYVDGQAVGTAGIVNGNSAAPLSGLGGVRIGRHEAWNTWLNGTVDEVAIYGAVLPAARVQAHRTAGAGYRAAVLADSPHAYYRVDDGTVGTGAGPNAIVSRPAYVQNDAVSATATSVTGRYLVDYPAFDDVEDPAGNRYQCSYNSYDGQGFVTGQSSGLTLGRATTQDRYTGCGNAGNGFAPGGQIRTTNAFDLFGNQVASSDPDANAGVSGHLGCTVGGTSYSSCTTYDGTSATLPVRSANALGQTTSAVHQSTVEPSPAVVDVSGHAKHAAWSGRVGFGASGLVSSADTAMSFDGSSSYVAGPALTPLQGGSTRSVELWFETSSTGSQQLLDAGDTWLTGQSFQLGLTGNGSVGGSPSSNTPGVYLNLFGDDVYLPGLNLGNGQSHHLVVTLSGSSVWIYVDGSTPGGLVWNGSAWSGSTAQPFTLLAAPNTPATPLWIGQARRGIWGGGSAFFSGTIDEVAVYDHVLSAARVAAHRSAGAGYGDAVMADSPSAYYRLDDNTGAAGPLGGFGRWPLTRTDANGQTTTLGYDALGRETSRSLPSEQEGGAPAVLVDGSGRGNQAAWGGGVSFGAAGLVSGDSDVAMRFNGASGSMEGPALAPLQGGSTRSVELWFKTSSTAQQPLVDAGGDDGAGRAFIVALTQSEGVGGGPPVNTPGLYLNVWGAGDTYLPGLNLADGQPHHLALTLSASSLWIYVDGATPGGLVWSGSAWGAQSQPFALPVVPATAARPVWIGHSRFAVQGAGTPYFNGTIDEVALYDQVLTAARVAAHRTAGAGYRAAVLADSPSAYYRLDDRGPAQTTLATAYTVWCSGSAAQAPCVEVDRTQRLDATTTVTARAFYDGLGHLVETRSPGPGGQDVVRYSHHDPMGRLVFQSVPYLVGAYSGGPGAAAYSIPDSTVAGTTTAYDGLGRVLTATDALSFQSRRSYAVICAPAGTGDSGCFEQTLTVDARGHQQGALVDGLGRTAYVQRYTGSGPATYALYATTKHTYDFLGQLVRIVHPDGSTQTTFGYDMAGRETAMSDPDLGAQTYACDQDGNLVQSVDARGSAGTIFMGYDGLDRPIWRNTTNSPTGAYDTYSYDATAGGNVGVGRLTGESFSAGGLTGSRGHTYDSRGRQAVTTLTVGGISYPLTTTYDDADNVLTRTYPNGEIITNSYAPSGWLSGVTTTRSGTTTTLASNLAYTGVGGGFGELTAMHLGGGYDHSASYDLLDRATDLKTRRTSDSVVLFDQARTFDGAGNVATAQTTIPAGTDNQAFCYDEQDRVMWASSASGIPPCGGTANTAGTLTAAQYTHSFTYDTMGRLATGPLGSYTYGSSAHTHAASAIGVGWTAAYDAAGNLTCRAPTSASTCAGTQTGAQLGYNNEGELASWQNAPSSPSTTAQFLYDGQGQRVEQVVSQGGTTTTTVYVGGVEEVATSGGTTTTTTYYHAGGKRIGLSVNGVVSYLAADGLGSANVTLSSAGSATASVLFAPYGAGRYSSGTMPTSYGFTGQRADAVSGLDYYGSRYYDPQAGQFTSGDSVLPGGGLDPWGLSRYAYVEGNPVNRIDPDGHINLMVGDDGSAVPIENAFSGTYSWGGSPVTYHRGFIRSYPASRSIARARTPARPVSAARAAADQSAGDDAQAVLQSNLNRANSITTAQLLSSTRDNWSSLDDDTTAALAWLSGGGSPDRWCQSTKCRNGMQSALQYVDDVWSLLLLAITARSLAFDVAKATGGTLTAHTKGYTVGIDYGSRGIVVRLMKEGGGRTNYYRVSVPGKAAYTVMGDVSTDPARTHIPIEESSLKDITGIVKRIKEG